MYISFLQTHINLCIAAPMRQALPKNKPRHGGVCVCLICKDVKLRFRFYLVSRGTGADLPIQSNEAMAFRWMSGLINHLYLQFRFLNFSVNRHGKRPSLEPHSGIFTSRLSQSGIPFGHLLLVQLHQNLPQSKDVENIFGTICLHDRRLHRRRQ
jgi:hypothetical protein